MATFLEQIIGEWVGTTDQTIYIPTATIAHHV